VIRATPDYLLRAPDARETPFLEVLNRYYKKDSGILELHPGTELRIENAYYGKGLPKRGLTGYLGTETASYHVGDKGLRLLSVKAGLANPPDDQPPVEKLLKPSAMHFRYYRFFYQVLVNHKSDSRRGAILLGANSVPELNRLAEQLPLDPDGVCGSKSAHCTVFPEACTVSLEIEIVVNNQRRTVSWDSRLASIAPSPSHLTLLRLSAGRLAPVELDPADPAALRLPLLPGDHIVWD
jgi:hypothetical protein